jgi:hypothetical protein
MRNPSANGALIVIGIKNSLKLFIVLTFETTFDMHGDIQRP